MKDVAAAITKFTAEQIQTIEGEEKISFEAAGQIIEVELSEVEIITEDIPGWVVNVEDGITVALDITLTDELREEGIAREFINRIQNIRKDSGYEVTDRIEVLFEPKSEIIKAIENNYEYICSEILADKLEKSSGIDKHESAEVEITDNVFVFVKVNKINKLP